MISEHGSTLGLDGWNVFFMHECSLYLCLLCMHGSGHFYSCVSMYALMFLLLGCLFHQCMPVVYAFFIHANGYCGLVLS